MNKRYNFQGKTGSFRVCDICGIPFEVDRGKSNQKNCNGCSSTRVVGKTLKEFYAMEESLKRNADISGNAKVYTAVQHSQDFLRSLIPRPY